jgi:REP element-mobilizing transposase RayT
MRARQLTFFTAKSFRDLNRRAHGGETRAGKRKLARPFDPKRPLHIVLRSSQAKGDWSFFRARNEKRVKHLIYQEALRSDVRVYQFANSGNHLHLVLRAKTRVGLARFLRAVAGLIARAVTGAKKGVALATSGTRRAFWDALAYSRIVEWGKEFVRVCDYLTLNELEGLGWWEFGRAKKSPGFS